MKTFTFENVQVMVNTYMDVLESELTTCLTDVAAILINRSSCTEESIEMIINRFHTRFIKSSLACKLTINEMSNLAAINMKSVETEFVNTCAMRMIKLDEKIKTTIKVLNETYQTKLKTEEEIIPMITPIDKLSFTRTIEDVNGEAIAVVTELDKLFINSYKLINERCAANGGFVKTAIMDYSNLCENKFNLLSLLIKEMEGYVGIVEPNKLRNLQGNLMARYTAHGTKFMELITTMRSTIEANPKMS